MHPADKAVLRLAIGLGLAVLVGYGLALKLPFVACVLAVVVLCKPGPPMPFLKGLVGGFIVAAVLLAGVAMVPLLQHYAFTGVLVTAALLYALFFTGARQASPLTTILVIACTVIPVAGVADQQLSTVLATSLGAGLPTGALVSAMSHALSPAPPRPAPAGHGPPAGATPEAARWTALQATLVVLPAFLLALTNPALYMPTIMKSAMLGQQAGATSAR